ncbi:MAG TPA: tetratricopeptide repeat protein [Nevskiaceae bacterium]|nr:tetratricopeptide repeat protein [Nevskiaceae bacterium]
MTRTLAIIAMLLTLAGCAMPVAKGGSSTSTEAAIHTDLIRGLLDHGQYFAALAHIDEEQKANGKSDALSALRADALAAMGRTAEADEIYRSLLHGDYAGDAYHGLGLLHVRSNPGMGIDYLRKAVAAHPTNAQWRNDLGYALMSNGLYAGAQTELATATELDPASEKYRNNLVILLILMKDEARIARIRQQWGLKPDTLGELRRQAQAVQVQARPVVTPAAKPARKG